MPDGSFDLDYVPPCLDSDALAVAVYRYDPAAGADDSPFSILPNVRVLQVERREGPVPSTARFAYVLDDVAAVNWGWPNEFEELWPLDAQGDYVVQCDDRIVVMGQNPDGSPLYLFDGFAQVPAANVTGRSQAVTFAATGVEARTYDDVLHTIVQRDADTPQDTSGQSDTVVHLPVRFNPADTPAGGLGGFLANGTAGDYYTIDTDVGNYPVFLDPLIVEREGLDDPVYLAPWTIAGAVVYLCAIAGPGDEGFAGATVQYVTWPSDTQITQALATLVPGDDGVFDPATATTANCDVRDYDATGKTRPEVISELLSFAGFLMCWQLDSDDGGNPETWLKLYRRDAAAAGEPKPVYLAPSGFPIDTSTTNLAQLHLSRDVDGLVNAWRTETAQRQVEVCLTLGPLFEPAAGDEMSSPGTPQPPTTGRGAWVRSNWTATTPATQRRKYRWYGADECGDGHWNGSVQGWIPDSPFDFSTVFPPAQKGGPREYTIRYRSGQDTLIALDTEGRPLKAVLEINPGATTTFPGIGDTTEGDGSGWRKVSGGWRLLPDRLGIEVTVEDPENWFAGKGFGDIRGVTWAANPPKGKQFALRLTTVIEDDRRIKAEAPKRVASPTQFARRRGLDSRDHFQYCTIDKSSPNYTPAGGDGTNPVVVRDDTEAAKDHAEQQRSASEMPRLSGTLVIPYITTYYEVGDRIDAIDGRDVGLQTSVGTAAGEDPTFPWVVAVAWDFDGRQTTTLSLSAYRPPAKNSW